MSGEDGEHARRASRGRRASSPAEGVLRHLLARAEAVEDGAALEPAIAQVRVDAAAEVVVEVDARVAGRLVEGEVGGAGEGERDAAQPDALGAVGPQRRAVCRDRACALRPQ